MVAVNLNIHQAVTCSSLLLLIEGATLLIFPPAGSLLTALISPPARGVVGGRQYDAEHKDQLPSFHPLSWGWSYGGFRS